MSERITGDAAVLAMYAGSGTDHYGAFWTADPITAVTAGRLQTDKGSGMGVEVLKNIVLFAIFDCLNSAVENRKVLAAKH